MSKAEKQMAGELFGQDQQPKPALEAVKETIQSIAPGLSWDQIIGDVGHELKEKLSHGAHELASALFNGSGFVMYPRGTRDDLKKDGHGVHGSEQEQDEEKLEKEGKQQDRGGREM